MIPNTFRDQIEELMSKLPEGKVTTYGDLAALAGHPYSARIVGGIAHFGKENLPWHRLVNRFGGLASGYPGGKDAQEQMLEIDNIKCTDHIVDNFEKIRWKPT